MGNDAEVGGDVSRRDFAKATVSAGVGVLLADSGVGRAAPSASGKKRYAIVGVGGRSGQGRY